MVAVITAVAVAVRVVLSSFPLLRLLQVCRIPSSWDQVDQVDTLVVRVVDTMEQMADPRLLLDLRALEVVEAVAIWVVSQDYRVGAEEVVEATRLRQVVQHYNRAGLEEERVVDISTAVAVVVWDLRELIQ